MISRKDIVVPPFYQGYVNAVASDDLTEALDKSTRQFRKLLKKIPKKKIDFAYAPGKWTIRELFQHVIDAERVFVFRAMWFSRKDPAPLPGFDEKEWTAAARASSRRWKDMVEEFLLLRKASQKFFASLDDEQLQLTGTANNNTISVAGFGFVCAGHVAHHARILRERYLVTPPRNKKKKGTEVLGHA